MQVSTLRPGLLVSLKTSITGNVRYNKRTIEPEHLTSTGAELVVWETERQTADPVEHDKALKSRNEASNAIRSVCSNTAFGLLCPEANAEKLGEAIAKARAVTEEFNSQASITRIGVYVVTGRVAQDDVEAVRAINSEVRDLLASMKEGLSNLDVKQVRAAALKAKSLGQMLSEEASEKVMIAIEAARKSAKEIVKAGEGAAVEIDRETIKRIEQQRVAFLDLDDTKEIATPTHAGRAIELDPSVKEASDAYVAQARQQLEVD